MKSIISGFAVVFLGLLALSPPAISDDRPVLTGHVIKVVDGDTIDVRLQSGQIRIRFHGVDAPEKSQDHGKAAASALSLLVMDKDVHVEPFEPDRYDRLVAIVYVDELNVNTELVRRGHAWARRALY